MSDFPLTAKEPFHGLSHVLDSVTKHRDNRLESTRQMIAGLAADWCEIRRTEIEKNSRENHHFNPLRHIRIKETDHSRILGGLLNPHGNHGQKSLFLHSFLDLLGIEPRDGRWTVAVESSGHVDILLRRDDPASVVIIENKANSAQDQDGQLYRYWFKTIFSPYPEIEYDDPETAKRFRVVYLPPGGYARPAERSLIRPADLAYSSCPYDRLPMAILDCRSFRTDVTGWLKELAGPNLSPRLVTFLNIYSEIWKI